MADVRRFAGRDEFRRSLSTVAIADGLLYAADSVASLSCFDVRTGTMHWQQDAFWCVWGSPLVVDGKVYLGTTDGEIVVLGHNKKLDALAANDMLDRMYTTPVAAGGVLYIATCRRLVAIERTER